MSLSSTVAFPLSRRRDLVHEVADGLRSHHMHEANVYWRETAKRLLHQLTLCGVPKESAEEEVRSLLYAALDEMRDADQGASA